MIIIITFSEVNGFGDDVSSLIAFSKFTKSSADICNLLSTNKSTCFAIFGLFFLFLIYISL